METWGKVYWPIFLIISSLWLLLAFGIAETMALVEDTLHIDNTLSNYARTELHAQIATSTSPHTIVWWLTFIVWMMFVVFITAHIWFDQFG